MQNFPETNSQQRVNEFATGLVTTSTSIRRWIPKGFMPKDQSESFLNSLMECRELASEKGGDIQVDIDFRIDKALLSFDDLESAIDTEAEDQAARLFFKDFGDLRKSIVSLADIGMPPLSTDSPTFTL